MFSLRAYGTAIDSAIALPQLPERSTGPADVTIERADATLAPSRADLPDDRTRSFDGYGTIVLESDDRLVVAPDPDADDEAIQHLILGPGLRLLFHHRGDLVLHGSAVAVDGVAVAFLGASGAGKSTTAAAFAAHGHYVLADDVLVVPDPSEPTLQPGVSAAKLDDATASALDLDARASPDADAADETSSDESPNAETPSDDRRFHVLDGPDATEPLPLARCYLLREGDDVAIDPAPAGEAVYELMYHSVGDYDDADATQDDVGPHFEDCAALARTAGVAQLERPQRLEALPQLVAAVEDDCSCATS